MKITRQQAEEVRAAIKQQWPDHDGEPTLRGHEHEQLRPGCWSIDWDGGPYDWPMHAFQTHTDEETYWLALEAGAPHEGALRIARVEAQPQPHEDKIFTEPINSCTLGLYPH